MVKVSLTRDDIVVKPPTRKRGRPAKAPTSISAPLAPAAEVKGGDANVAEEDGEETESEEELIVEMSDDEDM